MKRRHSWLVSPARMVPVFAQRGVSWLITSPATAWRRDQLLPVANRLSIQRLDTTLATRQRIGRGHETITVPLTSQ